MNPVNPVRWTVQETGKHVSAEIKRQDACYGRFLCTAIALRAGLALLGDELAECVEAWDDGHHTGNDYGALRDELTQVAALAMRLARDINAEEVKPGGH